MGGGEQVTTLREFAWAKLRPIWMRYGRGARDTWVSLDLVGDVCADLLLRCAMTGLVLTPYCSGGAAALIGKERKLPRFTGESLANYKLRLWGAWDAWEYAGTEKGILGQLQAAGMSTTLRSLRFAEFNFDTGQWGASELHQAYCKAVPYVATGQEGTGQHEASSFVLVLTVPSSSGPEVLECVCGDETICGESVCGSRIAISQLESLNAIIEQFKPSEMICRKVCFAATDDGATNFIDTSIYPYVIPRGTPEFY